MFTIERGTFKLTAGDLAEFELEIIDFETREAADMTNATGVFRIKHNPNDLDTASVLEKSFYTGYGTTPEVDADKEGGKVRFRLIKADTENLEIKKYFYEIIIIDENGEQHTQSNGDLYLFF